MKKLLLLFVVLAGIQQGFISIQGQYVTPVSLLEVPSVSSPGAITIDGNGNEPEYGPFITDALICKRAGANLATREVGDAYDFNAKFKVCWDLSYLYFYAEVIDDNLDLYENGFNQSWTWDNIEVFIDLDTNSRTSTYGTNSTTQMRFCPGLIADNGVDSVVESNSRFKIDEFLSAWYETATGYKLEVAIPWIAATASEDGVDICSKIAANNVLGFDVSFTDSDGDHSDPNGGSRNFEGGAQMFWDLDDPIGNEDNAYQNRRTFGWMVLDQSICGSPPPSPCDNVTSIGGCGSGFSQTYTGGGSGVWFTGTFNPCGYMSPGVEKIYSFIAPETGRYSIQVTAASGYVDYMWKSSSCSSAGWSCIDDIMSPGNYGLLSWTAGNTYYILLDDEDGITGTHTFYIKSPATNFPFVEYASYAIDDDNSISSGDNDGLAEPGETIEMMIWLANIGGSVAHNVFVVLTSPDPDIHITDASEFFGNIPAGDSSMSSGSFIFSIARNCPEKDVVFNLDITSNEDIWDDQFSLPVHRSGTSVTYFQHDLKLIIYPNPTTDLLFLRSESDVNSHLNIRLLDNLGRTVYSKNYPVLNNKDLMTVDLSNCQSGIYILQIESGEIKNIKIIRE
jgi:hypothetical protein